MNTKMKMRLLSLLFCFVMLVGLLPTTVLAATTITITGLTAPQAGQSVEAWFDGNFPVFSPNYDFGGGYWFEGAFDNYEELSDEDEFLGNFVSGRSYTLYLWLESDTPTLPLNATLNVPGATCAVYEYYGEDGGVYYADIMIVYIVTAPNPTYTVTFDSNGGSAVTAQTIEAGQKATKPADPTKANYAFAGWYSDSGLTQAFDFNTPITGDTTLYAKWDVVITAANATITVPVAGEHPDFHPISGDSSRYTVTFETWYLHESPYPDLEANSVFEHGKYYSLRVRFTPNAGYQFDSNTVFTVNGEATASFGGIGAREYSAAAYATTYTVTYDANGGSGSMADATGVSGEYTLLANGFTAPDGKQFKAWSVGGDEKAVGDKITVTANTTVTAIWENISEYTKKGDISAVEATADLPPVLGATTSTSVTITDPTDAAAKGVVIAGTSWYKKDPSSIYGWTQCSNGVDTFEAGTYRLSVQLRSKSNDDKEYYAMSDATTFTVNDVQWNSEEPFRDYYASDGYGYRFFVSPEFTLGGKTLDSIAVTTPPTKTAYREGEDFSSTGMVVTATYTDSTTAPVVLYTVTDGTAMAAGKTSVTISYTEGGVTKTTTQAITVAKEYTVTVEGGTGNGKYIVGEAVSISAFVSTGMQFKEWQGTDGLTFTSGDKNSQTATFTMPAHDVTVTAVTGPAEYYVSVSGGSGTGMYETGEIVTIVADAPEAGKQFKAWVVGDGKVLNFTESTITDSTAKFIMPGEAVRIEATYEDIPATTYTVSFDANGGTGTMADVTGISGEYTLPSNGFTAPDGKQFKAWRVGGVTKAAGDKITVTADTTVTAVWETIPTTPGGDKPNNNPPTGDNSMMWLWIALLFVSGFGVVATTVIGKKKSSAK